MDSFDFSDIPMNIGEEIGLWVINYGEEPENYLSLALVNRHWFLIMEQESFWKRVYLTHCDIKLNQPQSSTWKNEAIDIIGNQFDPEILQGLHNQVKMSKNKKKIFSNTKSQIVYNILPLTQIIRKGHFACFIHIENHPSHTAYFLIGICAEEIIQILKSNKSSTIRWNPSGKSECSYVGKPSGSWSYHTPGKKVHRGVTYNYGPGFGTGDLVGIFLDSENQTLRFSKNDELLEIAFVEIKKWKSNEQLKKDQFVFRHKEDILKMEKKNGFHFSISIPSTCEVSIFSTVRVDSPEKTLKKVWDKFQNHNFN